MRRHRGSTARRAERRVAALWIWPTLWGAAGLVAGVALLHVDLPAGALADVAWPGDTASALGVASTVAGSVITVTTLTFSLTVVALQLASQQFSPRLLREFARDPLTRASLCVLVAAFVLSVTVMRGIRGDAEPPHLAIFAVFVMGLAALTAVLWFITHLIRILRIDTMMLAVHGQTARAIKMFYPPYGDTGLRSPGPHTRPAGRGTVVLAAHSGFVRGIDIEALVADASSHHAFVDVVTRLGDHVVVGTPIAQVWPCSPDGLGELETLQRQVNQRVVIGYERTLEQDAAYGFRELEDIAVKALSRAINDPVTAAHAIGHMGDLLSRLLGCQLGAVVHTDGVGVERVIVPDRDLAYYLDLSCGQARRFGGAEPTVLVALLRMLRDAGASARDDHQREQIAREARLVVGAAAPTLRPEERAWVEEMEQRVRTVLSGDLLAAYRDRSGETRSI